MQEHNTEAVMAVVTEIQLLFPKEEKDAFPR
jgi:hypothetical protein